MCTARFGVSLVCPIRGSPSPTHLAWSGRKALFSRPPYSRRTFGVSACLPDCYCQRFFSQLHQPKSCAIHHHQNPLQPESTPKHPRYVHIENPTQFQLFHSQHIFLFAFSIQIEIQTRLITSYSSSSVIFPTSSSPSSWHDHYTATANMVAL